LAVRRVLRFFLSGATALSVVLCVATVALWVRSYWTADLVQWTSREGMAVSNSDRGRLTVEAAAFPGTTWSDAFADERGWRRSTWSAGKVGIDAGFVQDPSTRRHWHAMGFRWFVSDGAEVATGPGSTTTYFPRRAVGVPHWALGLAFAVAPAWWFRRHVGRPMPGCCPACGYDLRATPERCPECGRASP
jgi:hypothetical protein